MKLDFFEGAHVSHCVYSSDEFGERVGRVLRGERRAREDDVLIMTVIEQVGKKL
jgi:hypothetical protein